MTLYSALEVEGLDQEKYNLECTVGNEVRKTRISKPPKHTNKVGWTQAIVLQVTRLSLVYCAACSLALSNVNEESTLTVKLFKRRFIASQEVGSVEIDIDVMDMDAHKGIPAF